jgi:hypothetical protein
VTQPNYVSVLVKCSRHGQSINACVPVQRGVPEPLRCQPAGGVPLGGGSPLCEECQELLRGPRLRDVVNDLTRRGWSDHIKAGAVVVAC